MENRGDVLGLCHSIRKAVMEVCSLLPKVIQLSLLHSFHSIYIKELRPPWNSKFQRLCTSQGAKGTLLHCSLATHKCLLTPGHILFPSHMSVFDELDCAVAIKGKAALHEFSMPWHMWPTHKWLSVPPPYPSKGRRTCAHSQSQNVHWEHRWGLRLNLSL